MSVQQLATELAQLLADTKRKSPETRAACEKALLSLKSVEGNTVSKTSNNDIKNDILAAFIAACRSGNSKFVAPALSAINRLASSGVIPPNSINTLLEALVETTNLAVEVQLRTLQCLPALMQNYSVLGSSLLQVLSICVSLSAPNRAPMVANTAAATVQQVFGYLYENVKNDQSETTNSISIDNEHLVLVSDLSLEGFNILSDLCGVMAGEKPSYFTDLVNLKTLSVLEIIEGILSGHRDLFQRHQELAFLLRTKVVPAALKTLNSPSRTFPLVTRTIRIIHVLLSSQLDNLEVECELVLSHLNHLLLNNDAPQDPTLVNWEKILILEMFRALFADFHNIRAIFLMFDANPKKKNVVQELISIISTYLHHNSYLIHDVVHIPNTQPGSIYLSKQFSNLKVSVLDHLDKTEAPTNIPTTYSIFLTFKILTSYADGTANFVSGLSSNPDPKSLESDVDFITTLLKALFPDILSLFENFIYSSMDNDNFFLLVRTLQKYTHTTGLLGLEDLRDSLLVMMSEAITKNVSEKDQHKKNMTTLQEQGKQLLAFGESLVGSITSIQPPSSPVIGQYPNLSNQSIATSSENFSETDKLVISRSFNSRQATVLRAFSSLAVSLGSTLLTSWNIILKTFQWVDYYLNGPDEYSGYSNHKGFKNLPEQMLPKLSSQDLSNIESSKKKFYDSISEYPHESFHELLNVLTSLFDIESFDSRTSQSEENDKNETRKEDVEIPQICPYNRTYFLQLVINISSINSNHLLVTNERSWELLVSFFVSLATDRATSYSLRLHIVNSFTAIIRKVAKEGFASDDAEINTLTSQRTINALIEFLKSLFELGSPSELLVLNCETEVHLLILKTLYELIDQYDSYYKNTWDLVFVTLNTTFRQTESQDEDHHRHEKITLLIDSSYGTLKLILDEFMSSLPFNQLKMLIDTLYNFCRQTYDLNISFSSVSYFWLISDSIKMRIANARAVSDDRAVEIKTEVDLEKFLDSATEESQLFYQKLDIYLLRTLSKLSVDSRAQVRDGATQTFFQTIEVHGTFLESWDVIYDTVLPSLLDLKLENNNRFKSEWTESLTLILNGFVSVYEKYMTDFATEKTLKYSYWKRLTEYFERLLSLKWIELNVNIYKSFHQLLRSLRKVDGSPPVEITGLLFEFWTGVSVEYDFINSLYQDSLAVFVDSFPALFDLVAPTLTVDQTNSVLNILNQCGRYPILADNHNDTVRPTKLQQSVIDSLKAISVPSDLIRSSVILQLCLILVYPFSTRSRIESKLKSTLNGRLKISSFVAISQLSLEVLVSKLAEIDNLLALVRDGCVHKLLKSLLEIIQSRTRGLAKDESSLLWVQCNKVFLNVVTRLIDSNMDDIKHESEIWELALHGITICFNNPEIAETDEDENANAQTYRALVSKVVPALLSTPSRDLTNGLIEGVYQKSFLYAQSDIEESLLAGTKDPQDKTSRLAHFAFNDSFGSTQPVVVYGLRNSRFLCLQELIRFASVEDLADYSMPYFVARTAYTLRRFIADERLLFRSPLPRIQEQELIAVMNGLLLVQNTANSAAKKHLKELTPLLMQAIAFSARIKGLPALLEQALVAV